MIWSNTMKIRKSQRWIALSAVLVLSIVIFKMQQIPTPLDGKSTSGSGSLAIVTDNPGLPTATAAIPLDKTIQIAGNAPCNPEQQVCDK